jgi:hypothetical protein
MQDGCVAGPVVSEKPKSSSQKCNRRAKVKFTPDEDAALLKRVLELGTKDWTAVASKMGSRNARQCRERFKNYLNPDLRKEAWSSAEDQLLEKLFKEYGPKWNRIGRYFEYRSDNSLRNRWMMLARHKGREAAKMAVLPVVPMTVVPNNILVTPYQRPQVVPILAPGGSVVKIESSPQVWDDAIGFGACSRDCAEGDGFDPWLNWVGEI